MTGAIYYIVIRFYPRYHEEYITPDEVAWLTNSVLVCAVNIVLSFAKIAGNQ